MNSNNQLNLTVTATPGNDFLGACVMSVAGLDPVNPVDVVATHDITSGQLHMVSPSITTNYPNELAVSLTSCRYTSQKSEPNGGYQFTFTDVGGCGAGILLLNNQVSGLQAQFLQDDAPGPYAATIVTFKGAGQSASNAALGIAMTHSGSFIQGQQGAAYTVNVSNAAGAGSTSGAVTVTETAPSGLTLVSMSGTGWSCAANICTRSDALAGGAGYPPITVIVNVAANATSPQVNRVMVSGGSSADATANDSTVISANAPALSLSKSHIGNFMQGQQGATYTLVVSNDASAGPTSGTVTVTEMVPSGLTLAGLAGVGWSCTSNTCSRAGALAPGASYPTITATVNVAAH